MKQTCLGLPVNESQGQEANPGVSTAAYLARIPWGGMKILFGISFYLFSLSLSQGQQSHRYGVPASSTRDKDGFPRPLRTPGPPRYRPVTEGTQSSTRKAGPHHWQAKGGLMPRTLPDPGSPRLARNARPLTDGRATEAHPSPFGIPYSKLSQSKHLKVRTGGGQWASSDSKRRVQAPRDHKDP